jgi:hypothetical protein
MQLFAGVVESRDDLSARGMKRIEELWAPTEPKPEQVFNVEPAGDANWAVAKFASPAPLDGLSLNLRCSRRSLPWLVAWKQLSRGTYVTALEPSDCHDDDRAVEHRWGALVGQDPGEQRLYSLEVSIEHPALRQ